MNIITVFERFPTQADCIKHLEKARWGDQVLCPYCKSSNTAPLQHRHRCYSCKTSFSVTVRTIFHHTHMPLQKWFLAVTLILNAKKGLSALRLSRDLQVNKNTAWRIAMQIRKAMTQSEQRGLLTGIVEMDETYIGGKPRKGTKGDEPDGQYLRGLGQRRPPWLELWNAAARSRRRRLTRPSSGDTTFGPLSVSVSTRPVRLLSRMSTKATWVWARCSHTPLSSIKTGMWTATFTRTPSRDFGPCSSGACSASTIA